MSWVNRTFLEQRKEIHRFVRGMIAFRRAHPVLSREKFYTDPPADCRGGSTTKNGAPACVIQETGQDALLMVFNAGPDGIAFPLPDQNGRLAFGGRYLSLCAVRAGRRTDGR